MLGFIAVNLSVRGDGGRWFLGSEETRAATDRVNLGRVNADSALAPANRFEADHTVDLGVDRVILANPNVVANPELGAALAHHNGARADVLAIGALHAKSL